MLILRFALFVIIVSLLVMGTVWLADHPGRVVIDWLGWRVESSVAILLIVALAVVILFFALIKLTRAILFLPMRLMRHRRERRHAGGMQALSESLAALLSGDAPRAGRLAKRAGRLLQDGSVATPVSAEAAHLAGDETQAEKYFTDLVQTPQTAFMGLRGLMLLAIKQGKMTQALDYAHRAHALNPHAADIVTALYDLQIRAGQWVEAEETINQALADKTLPAREGGRKLAFILHHRACATAEDDRRLELEENAVKADPGFVPAVLSLGALQSAKGRAGKAAKAIERAWAIDPHPALVDLYLSLWPEEDPLARIKRAEHLAKKNPAHPESAKIVAKAAIEAKLWGVARDKLLEGVKKRPSADFYQDLARLEEDEKKDTEAARAWLDKAAAAPPPPVWQCRECGAASPEWVGLCPECGAVDSVSWRSPTPRLTAAQDGGP